MPDLESAAAKPRNTLAALLAAYRRCCPPGGAGVPRREDLTLADLADLLGWEFFAEWVAPDSITVRLSGTHIDYVLGRSVTGVNFFEKYRPHDRALYARFYAAIADHPCGGYTVRQVIVGGDEAYDYHSIYLPLARRASYVPIVGAVWVGQFERVAARRVEGHQPDFRALGRIGLFDIGFGVPAGDLETVDIAAVIAAIDAKGGATLDRDALEARPMLGRPPSLG
jgi:hypothetical protein